MRSPRPSCRLCFALCLVLASLPVHAVDYELGEGKLTVSGSVTAGGAWRASSQDTALLPNVNSSQVGITGTAIAPTAGRNQDDGNLNYNKGDPVSQVVNGYLALGYKAGDYGAAASIKAWYDYALENDAVPWGNIPNGYTPNAPLSDAGAQPRTRFSGIALDNLNVYGHNAVAGAPLDWTLGWQKLEWGIDFSCSAACETSTPSTFRRSPGRACSSGVRRRVSRCRRSSRGSACRSPPASKASTSSTSSAMRPTNAAPSIRPWITSPKAATR